MYKVGVITASDKGSRGERIDESGKVIIQIVESFGLKVEKYSILPDEKEALQEEMINMADKLKVNLILTTGGTGFSKRDVTPEATRAILEREASGIVEAIRHFSLSITPRAMLSRAVSGIRGETLIINLPGSPKAVRESLEYVMETVIHGLNILSGQESECARK